ncbi:MAG TPA: response regulator [Candidatus Thermoplasmatota archaeon]|nr:response regulator [Candidatus Thermoplasmatota archaeon]
MPVTDAPTGKKWDLRPRAWVLLLVDDDPDILDALGNLVEQTLPGVRVVRALSGREGLGVLQAERIDGIIADFDMGDMDGLEFLRIARQCHPTIPRAMLTGYADPELRQLAKHEARVQSFLSKLAEPDEFLERVCTMLTYQPAINPGP